MKKPLLTAFISLSSLLGFSYFTPVNAATGPFYPPNGVYAILSGGQSINTNWRVNMSGDSAGWGTPAITYWSSKIETNDMYAITWDNTHRAYTVHPLVEKNGDACLTENSQGFLELQKCKGLDYSDNQHFWFQCTNQDSSGNLTGCYISNALKASQAIGTYWNTASNPIGETNTAPNNAQWWSLESVNSNTSALSPEAIDDLVDLGGTVAAGIFNYLVLCLALL